MAIPSAFWTLRGPYDCIRRKGSRVRDPGAQHFLLNEDLGDRVKSGFILVESAVQVGGQETFLGFSEVAQKELHFDRFGQAISCLRTLIKFVKRN
jgi:hypothetical protein